MKPWEERWFTKMKGAGVELLRERETGDDIPLIARSFEQASGDMQLARMNLAAAAPEMARALIAIEWDGGDVAGNSICPFCCADKYPEEGRNHKPDCALAAALRKAGIR